MPEKCDGTIPYELAPIKSELPKIPVTPCTEETHSEGSKHLWISPEALEEIKRWECSEEEMEKIYWQEIHPQMKVEVTTTPITNMGSSWGWSPVNRNGDSFLKLEDEWEKIRLPEVTFDHDLPAGHYTVKEITPNLGSGGPGYREYKLHYNPFSPENLNRHTINIEKEN